MAKYTYRKRIGLRAAMAGAQEGGAPAQRPRHEANDQTRAVLGTTDLDALPEASYRAQAKVLMARRAWVLAELARAEEWAAARRKVAQVRASDPVIPTLRKSWQRQLPPGVPRIAESGQAVRYPITGKTRRGSYWTEIGYPPECGPDDRLAAGVFARKVAAALERGGWGNAERARLGELFETWSARARGEDVRFRVVGNVPGRLPRQVERQIRAITDSERGQQP
jgi:hypothetical protein